jgi:K+-transporting ATPase c subunit
VTLPTGMIYPARVAGVAQALVSEQANGSLIQNRGKAAGSALIGPTVTGSGHFQGVNEAKVRKSDRMLCNSFYEICFIIYLNALDFSFESL